MPSGRSHLGRSPFFGQILPLGRQRSAPRDPNGPKLSPSHCSLPTPLKLAGCLGDLSFDFFFRIEEFGERKGASVPPGLDVCERLLGLQLELGPSLGSCHAPALPERVRSCNRFFSASFFQLGWHHPKEGHTRKRRKSPLCPTKDEVLGFNTSGASELKWLHTGCMFQWAPIRKSLFARALGFAFLFKGTET